MQAPASSISVREAEREDLTYIDSLQTKFADEVGYFSTKTLVEYIENHYVSLALLNGEPAAYLLGRDTSDFDPSVARVYQTAVQMDARHLAIGKALVDFYCDLMPLGAVSVALFCAQDIQANLFWEALGFQAVGFREGSRHKERLHILWQRSTRPQDEPLFVSIPDFTRGGAMRQHREVFPLHPGQDWRHVTLPGKKVVVPVRTIESPNRSRAPRAPKNKITSLFPCPKGKVAIIASGKIHYREKHYPLA